MGHDLVTVRRVAYRRCGEGQQFLDALVLRHLQRLGDERVELLDALVGQPVAVLEVISEPKLGLMRVRGPRTPAPVCVDDQQVNGVRPDVEHTQSHELTLPNYPKVNGGRGQNMTRPATTVNSSPPPRQSV